MIDNLHAETAAPATPSAQSQPSPFMSFAPLVVIFVIFYFLLIRPQQKKMNAQKKMLEDLKKGDRILTASGIYGVIVNIGDSSVDVKLSDNVKVKMLKSSVTEKLGSEETDGANGLGKAESKVS